MPETSPLKARIRSRLREAFGEPNERLGRADHWLLRPHANANLISVLIEDESSGPAVWMFDPHDQSDGVHRECIEREEQIGELIDVIKSRLGRHELRHTPKTG